MVTQLILSKRVIATEEMKQVAKDEQVDFNFILKNVANGSIIIPKNMVRKTAYQTNRYWKGTEILD
jgi:phosphomethylpyrimidine synthase